MPINELLTTFANNLLPILLIGGAGFLLGKALSIDARSLGRVVFYVFSPILVFNLILHTELDSAEILITMAFSAAVCLAIGVLALTLGSLLRLERAMLIAVILTAAFGNTGNYGLPLVSFAFGGNALAYATLYFVTTSILFNTLGVLIASLGHMDVKAALLGLYRVPTMYAVILGALLNRLQIGVPVPLARTVEMAANGSIPLMIVLLGLELARVQWSNNIRAVGLSTALRLLAGPAVGLLLAGLFGLPVPAWQGNITQSAMPAAITTTVLAAEYGLDTSLVTATVFIGTLLSPLTLTPLLVYLGRL
jgi:predicted permease